MSNLLQDIEAFCQAHNLTDRQFGLLVLNDKNLIGQLKGDGGKRPRRLWPETEAKIRRTMAGYRPEQADAA